MTSMLYQAKAGDGFKMRGMNRRNSFFKTPKEAVSEALALKEKMDKRYENDIEWDYNGEMTSSANRMKFLKGYLGGDRKSKPFYLQIVTVDNQEDGFSVVSPKKPRTVTAKDKKVLNKVIKLFK
ncbi:hypothetical protein [Aquibacillus rhizosphaerae]|uniref:Uncharacterized protein n=1 Tax=Aquibacillus rhizosphaerae TaxID=3051431 RepID=A0ABT7L5U3_9BACI|nr:hypothetical protein [Aquibacillus sp. LR5S19]MDL4841229.1 hypothetical protein [Aquibacillus sp. LR5S19]